MAVGEAETAPQIFGEPLTAAIYSRLSVVGPRQCSTHRIEDPSDENSDSTIEGVKFTTQEIYDIAKKFSMEIIDEVDIGTVRYRITVKIK